MCKVEKEIGSIIPRRTCHTQAEWERMTATVDDSLNRLRDSRTGKIAPTAH